MTYASTAEQYADPETRARINTCATEQAHVYTLQEGPTKTLADKVIAQWPEALNALAYAVLVSPNGPMVDNDGDLLSAMQSVWERTAQALYPPEPEEEPPPPEVEE